MSESSESVVYGGRSSVRVRVHHLQQAKERGEKWAMLTAYDVSTAAVFEEAGIPVMAHVGFTPQSEHGLGGYRVQGRGAGAEQLLADARAVQEAGAFAVVLEMVPADVAAQVTKELAIPTIGIGAGVECDAQVLVWPDMAGLTGGRVPRFVKRYADLRGELLRAAREYADEVRSGAFPAAEHSFE